MFLKNKPDTQKCLKLKYKPLVIHDILLNVYLLILLEAAYCQSVIKHFIWHIYSNKMTDCSSAAKENNVSLFWGNLHLTQKIGMLCYMFFPVFIYLFLIVVVKPAANAFFFNRFLVNFLKVLKSGKCLFLVNNSSLPLVSLHMCAWEIDAGLVASPSRGTVIWRACKYQSPSQMTS